jgi:hypothetical protein
MSTTHTPPHLHPDHLADLIQSGLSPATITELGIHTIPPRWIRKHLGYDLPQVESLLCFPYPGCDGFCRDKVFPQFKDKEGQPVRYLQRKESGSHFYIPPLAQAALQDPTVALYCTEGEKKAAKACQEQLPCIGLGGLWNWLHDGKPIADFDLVVWKKRSVLLVPDSDAWDRDDLLHAVYALGAEIERRGAKVKVVRLPEEGGA